MTPLSCKRKPCPTCPWRKDTAPHGFPGGSIGPRLLAMASGEFGMVAMQCHSTPDGEKSRVCVGFAHRVGFACVGLRVAALTGRYDPKEVDVEGVDLWEHPEDLGRVHGWADRSGRCS